MRLCLVFLSLAVAALPAGRSLSQTDPGPIVGGSPDVSVGGAAAARQGDATKEGAPVVQGSPDVFINGKPAATAGGKTACGGAVVSGTAHVFVNGKPLARAGDSTTGCAHK